MARYGRRFSVLSFAVLLSWLADALYIIQRNEYYTGRIQEKKAVQAAIANSSIRYISKYETFRKVWGFQDQKRNRGTWYLFDFNNIPMPELDKAYIDY